MVGAEGEAMLERSGPQGGGGGFSGVAEAASAVCDLVLSKSRSCIAWIKLFSMGLCVCPTSNRLVCKTESGNMIILHDVKLDIMYGRGRK